MCTHVRDIYNNLVKEVSITFQNIFQELPFIVFWIHKIKKEYTIKYLNFSVLVSSARIIKYEILEYSRIHSYEKNLERAYENFYQRVHTTS